MNEIECRLGDVVLWRCSAPPLDPWVAIDPPIGRCARLSYHFRHGEWIPMRPRRPGEDGSVQISFDTEAPEMPYTFRMLNEGLLTVELKNG
jgi:hypothetical protein